MNKNIKIFLRSVAVPLAAAVALALAVSASLAVYTNRGYKKGVAITAENKAMFSSNLLVQMAEPRLGEVDEYELHGVLASTYTGNTVQGEYVQTSFEIYNYAPNTPTRVNPRDIEYTLTITASTTAENVDLTGAFVQWGNQQQTKFTSDSCTVESLLLQHAAVDTHRFIVILPCAAVESGLTLNITARPTSASINAVNGMGLAVKALVVKTNGTAVDENSWSGHWVEQKVDGLTPQACTAFNYELSGTGSGKVTLTWPQALCIDSGFLSDIGKTTSEITDILGKRTVSFSVDASTQGVYTIRFYRTGDTFEGNDSDSFEHWRDPATFEAKIENTQTE